MRWIVAICALVGIAAMQDATPPVHKQGKMEVPHYWAADFDTGRVGYAGKSYIIDSENDVVFMDGGEDPPPIYLTSFKGSDFWFEPGARQYLRPQHGAMFSKQIVSDAAYSTCAVTAYSKNRVRVDNLPAGSLICIRTSAGRYANIQVNGYDRESYRLKLTYITWEKTNSSGTGKSSH